MHARFNSRHDKSSSKFKLTVVYFSNNPTIQKPYYRQSVDLIMAGFAESLRPEKFNGVNFKIWKSKVRLWFNAMHI